MSLDYDLVCLQCRRVHHLGQYFSSGWSFGHGRHDMKGLIEAGTFIVIHEGHDLRITLQQRDDIVDDTFTREDL